jgi:hypothetical protein
MELGRSGRTIADVGGRRRGATYGVFDNSPIETALSVRIDQRRGGVVVSIRYRTRTARRRAPPAGRARVTQTDKP